MRALPGALALVFVASTLSAWDYGLDLNHITSALVHRDAVVSEQDTASPWLALTSETSRFRAEGFVQYQGTFEARGSVQVPYRFDVKELSYSVDGIQLLGPGTATTVKVGRFAFADATTRILSGTFDGLMVRQATTPVAWTLQAGYTGLVAQKDVNVNVSNQDRLDYQGDNAPYLAPRRVFFGARAVWADVVDRHDLTVEALGQADLRTASPVHTGYFTASWGGHPASWFRWNLYAVGELWSDSVSIPAAAAGARIQFSAPALAGLVAVADAEWASGRTASTRNFVGIGEQPLGSVSPEVFSNVVVGRTTLALRAFPGAIVGFGNHVLFRAGTGPATDEDFPQDASALYLGDEALVTVDYAFAGELRLSGKWGAFLPNTAADAYGSGAPVRWFGAVDATWSW